MRIYISNDPCGSGYKYNSIEEALSFLKSEMKTAKQLGAKSFEVEVSFSNIK